MYRQFWLINALGERYDFSDKNTKTFLNTPNGFGFSSNYSVNDLGNSQTLVSESYKLLDIKGELCFYEKTNEGRYQDYLNFIRFVKHKPLEFHYLTPNSVADYYSEIVFAQADKGEVGADGVLRVGVSFHRLTQWLTSDYTTLVLRNESLEDGKHYNLIRPYHYSGTMLNDVPINNAGTDSVGFQIEIQGYVENPRFNLSQNGQIYGICKLDGNFDYVKVNSVENKEEIYMTLDDAPIGNPVACQDLTVSNGENYVTFIQLLTGENRFNFTCDNIDEFDGTIVIKFKHSYISV